MQGALAIGDDQTEELGITRWRDSTCHVSSRQSLVIGKSPMPMGECHTPRIWVTPDSCNPGNERCCFQTESTEVIHDRDTTISAEGEVWQKRHDIVPVPNESIRRDVLHCACPIGSIGAAAPPR